MSARESLDTLFIGFNPNAVDALLTVLREFALMVRHEAVSDDEALAQVLGSAHWDVILYSAATTGTTIAEVREQLGEPGAKVPIIGLYGGRVSDVGGRVNELLEAGATDAVARRNTRHLRFVIERELSNLQERRRREQCERALTERARQWETLLASSRDPVAYVHEGMHIHANRAYLQMFGFDDEDDLARVPLMDLIAGPNREELRSLLRQLDEVSGLCTDLEVSGVRLDGNTLEVKLEISDTTFEDERCWQLVLRDRSETVAIQAQLDYLRTRDPVTGLYNRDYFVDQLKNAAGDENEVDSLLVYLEVEGFNTYREQIGLEAADRIMVLVAQALRTACGDELLTARFGDGTFVVLGSPVSDAQIKPILQRLVRATEAVRADLGEHIVDVSCAMGASHFRSRARSPQSIVRKAQQACREIRERGGGQVRLKRQLQVVVETLDSPLADEVGAALDAERASLLFQPILGLLDDSRRMYEVFPRLQNADGGEIDVGGGAGDLNEALAQRLDRFVISRTIDLVREHQGEGHAARFFVNLTGQGMLDEELLLFITRALRDADVPGDRLVIEIGEALAVTHGASVKSFLSGLRQLGCAGALEHFGAGLCTVASMRQIPVDFIKIDRSLVARAVHDTEAETSLRGIVESARALGRETVAFGVEDSEALAKLWMIGVDFAQGDAIQSASQDLGWDFVSAEVV